MKLIVTIAAGLLLTACATTADTDSAAIQTADASAVQTADASDRICVREAPTGTRIPARQVCRSQAEWDEIRQRSQETAREIQRSPREVDTPRNTDVWH